MENEKTIKGVVMLVDDEEFVLSALERSLRRGPFKIVAFQSAGEALEFLEKESVDVVISDHRMPEMEGMEFLIEVRRRHPETIRILLTGHADMAVAIAGINDGKLFRFLTKPWDDKELRIVVERATEAAALARKSRGVVAELKKEQDYVHSLESSHPGISAVKRDKTGAIIIDE